MDYHPNVVTTKHTRLENLKPTGMITTLFLSNIYKLLWTTRTNYIIIKQESCNLNQATDITRSNVAEQWTKVKNMRKEANPLDSKSLQLGNFLWQSSLSPADLSIHCNSSSPIFLLRNKFSFLQIEISWPLRTCKIFSNQKLQRA